MERRPSGRTTQPKSGGVVRQVGQEHRPHRARGGMDEHRHHVICGGEVADKVRSRPSGSGLGLLRALSTGSAAMRWAAQEAMPSDTNVPPPGGADAIYIGIESPPWCQCCLKSGPYLDLANPGRRLAEIGRLRSNARKRPNSNWPTMSLGMAAKLVKRGRRST